MVADGESSDWLPSGFTEKIKYTNGRKIKYYYNVATGKKHYSKKDVLRAIADDALHVSPQTNHRDEDGHCDNENADNMPVEVEDPYEGLPKGWEVEEKVYKRGPKKGSSYKVYIEWSSGREFFSREAVDQYLNTLNAANTATIQNETKANDTPEWLPQGWTMEVRQRNRDSQNGGTYKVFIEGSSGKKFYSKPDVTRYLKSLGRANNTTVQNDVWPGSCDTTNNPQPGTPQTANGSKNVYSDTADNPQLGTPQTANGNKNVSSVSVKTNDTSQWLPEGWKVEEKPRKNSSGKRSSYKVYTELSTGNKCYSRPDVLRYLDAVKPANDKAVRNDIENLDKSFPSGQISEKKRTNNSVEVTTEKTAANDLPPGWIKEIRTKKSGSKIRKDPFYIDPVSGYMFRSKLDALRYVETNDVSRCACKPLKRESNDLMGELFGDQISEKKRTNNSEEVTTEKTTADDLPPGWIKEIRTKKSGRKIRKDPFYIDPVSGYVFRSKLDALRYVETNDISTCAIKPFKRGSDDVIGELFGGETSDKKSSASKKRCGTDLPSQTSKRLAEMPSNLELAHVEMDTSSPNIEPEKANNKKPEEETEGKASEKELEDVKKSPESQLGYDFGDSWSDPVDFALKTLCGEVPVEDNLPFPGSSKLPQSEKSPIITESSPSPSPGTRHGALTLLQSNPAFSGQGNLGCNGQSDTKDGEADHGTVTKL